MSRYELQPCRWRRPGVCRGRQGCESPIVRPGPFGVPDHICFICQVVDHRDPNARADVLEEAGDVRHLLYHLCPMGPAWRWHLDELVQRLGLFNGLRVMSVASGPGCAPPDEVQALLAGQDVQTIVIANDPSLREMAGYPLLLRRLSPYRGRADVHLYGHAKGASSEATFDGVREWSRTMLTVLLDYWPAVRRALLAHACVGIFRRRMHLVGHPGCAWHYSGSWRWARNVDWFARRWDEHHYNWASTETQPGSLFGYSEGACLFGEFEAGDSALYHAAAWKGWAGQARDRWCARHAADHWPAARADEYDFGSQNPCFRLQPAREGVAMNADNDAYAALIRSADTPSIDKLYEAACRGPSDIHEHLPAMVALGKECRHVTELGTHVGHSTTAWLFARPAVLVCYDLERRPEVDVLAKASDGTYFQFWQQDSLAADIAETELLFIDTLHDYEQLKGELARHAAKVRKYIVLHDTTTFAEQGETPGSGGLWPAVEELLAQGTFKLLQRYMNNNGLTVLQRLDQPRGVVC
jgi:hypothetical protein